MLSSSLNGALKNNVMFEQRYFGRYFGQFCLKHNNIPVPLKMTAFSFLCCFWRDVNVSTVFYTFVQNAPCLSVAAFCSNDRVTIFAITGFRKE